MKDYTMDQYTMQSYFKSLCKSFYFAYKQIKRLEKKKEEIEITNPQEELKTVRMLLRNHQKLQKFKTIVQVCSEEELEQRHNELENLNKVYEKKCKELEDSLEFWSERLWRECAEDIETVIVNIKAKNYTIIVKSKEEIFALMAFFREHCLKRYRVINIQEEYLKSFPTGKKMYEEFYAAYCLADDQQMEQVIDKYF